MTGRIEIPNWNELQHYSKREPLWIKNYTRLLNRDEYLDLSFHARGVLHGLWLAYAASGRQLADNTAALHRQLGGRVTTATLVSLNHAGFIELPASTRAPARSREERREENTTTPQTPLHLPDGSSGNGDGGFLIPDLLRSMDDL